MSTNHREMLKKIRTFPSLVKYLREELDWPIQTDDFEELTFEYTPEELGIDIKNAAKIQDIKRLRPLSVNQPWGIFFVKFEPKRLPVVALRRILSRVVVKKRSSANSAERAAWQTDDLLFVSNYGEGEERRISFAHFSQDGIKSDLPTLKVLGWDNLDTALHLDNVAEELRTKLTWPEDENDVDNWRQAWQSAFTLRHREVITTSKNLAVRLAELACAIRDRIKTALTIETESGPLTRLMKAFQEALVHDLDPTGFADTCAQTIAYGLLSARIADPEKKTADDFSAHMRTNPFLKELMQNFLRVGGRRGQEGRLDIDFDELGVSEVIELLDDANMEAVVRDFGDRKPQEDPVIHFYEGFAKAYDPIEKVKRGEFYTPRPVVSYIVRSVDELLRTEFGLEDGLADTTTWGDMTGRHKDLKIPEGVSPDQDFVQILDPATGTGTFLVEVIDLIQNTMIAKWKAQNYGEKRLAALWNDYVPKHLLPRLHAYELKMAPYAIAHLKIGLKLYETGYRFISDKRARVYLTNALEPASKSDKQLEFQELLPALAHEANAVNEIKQKQRFTVVIGNPPYSVSSTNKSKFIERLLDDYKASVRDERNLQPLSDDYVKFVRFAESLLCTNGLGVLGMITNHSFLFGLIHRGMREHLMQSFSKLRLLDLHGNKTTGELNKLGAQDQNVFDILQGVAITMGTRKLCRDKSEILFGELIGLREAKYRSLRGEGSLGPFQRLHAVAPHFFFRPKDFTNKDEYFQGIPISEILRKHKMGIQFGHVNFATDMNREELAKRIQRFYNPKEPTETIVSEYGLKDMAGWTLERERKTAFSEGIDDTLFCQVDVRPFDNRWTYFSKRILKRPVYEVMSHLTKPNLALIGARHIRADDYAHFLATDHLIGKDAISITDMCFVFPLYLYPAKDCLDFENTRRPNLNEELISSWLKRMNVSPSWLSSSLVNEEKACPEDIFHYAYAVFHSPVYRNRYEEFLKIDFPRLPLTGNLDLFRTLAKLGGDLVALHLMDTRELDEFISTYDGPKKPEVGRVGWSDGTVWLDAAKTSAREGHRATNPGTIGFRDVPEEVWDFYIGGYQVCHKWLKDRKRCSLSNEDLDHYQKIIVALNETIRIMKKIDEVIEKYGGWPDAFQSGG